MTQQLNQPTIGRWTIITAHLLAMAGALLWSPNFAMMKLIRRQMGAPELFLIRFDIATGFGLAVWLIRRPDFSELQKRHWILIVTLALMCGPVYQLLIISGAVGTSATLIAMLIATQTLHVGWIGWLLLGEKSDWRTWGAIGIAAIGIALPMTMDRQARIGATHIIYPLLVAAGGLVASLYVIIPRHIGKRISPIDLSNMVFIVGTATGQLLLLYTGLGPWWQQVTGLSSGNWICVFYLATIGHFAATWCWWLALRQLQGITVAFYLLLMIAASSYWGWLLLAEPLHWWDVLAMALVCLALCLNISKRKAKTIKPAHKPVRIAEQ